MKRDERFAKKTWNSKKKLYERLAIKTHRQAEVERLDQRRLLAPLNLLRSHQAKYQAVFVFIPGQLVIALRALIKH